MKKKFLLKLVFVLLAIITCVSFPIQSEAGRADAIAKCCTRCTKETKIFDNHALISTDKALNRVKMDSIIKVRFDSVGVGFKKHKKDMDLANKHKIKNHDNKFSNKTQNDSEVMLVTCPDCGGAGILFDINNNAKRCHACRGKGKVLMRI